MSCNLQHDFLPGLCYVNINECVHDELSYIFDNYKIIVFIYI